ncbi:MAG: hydrogenase nickel incorporation protein HypB [Gracilibacteraceae bacterium]|nr:hydrogenase nickel incorporation protein HypB [Gracilibacteraceae bacterium]
MSNERIDVTKNIYDENDRIAAETRQVFDQKSVFAVNVMGAPGAGKTSSIIQLINNLPQIRSYVLEGDIESDIDTVKMKSLGIETRQINTYGACHLDAPTVLKAATDLSLAEPGLLFIENIGNLVCPAEFMIGEHIKLLVCSVAEGSDKPYKYPLAFEKAQMILLTKIDLKSYVDFDDAFFGRGIQALNKTAAVFEVNARTGDGFAAAARHIEELARRARS